MRDRLEVELQISDHADSREPKTGTEKHSESDASDWCDIVAAAAKLAALTIFLWVVHHGMKLDPRARHPMTMAGRSNDRNGHPQAQEVRGAGQIADGAAGRPLGAMLYFSFMTLTTTGDGDLAPASALARALASLEAFVGVFYPATRRS